jgi:phosphohistidine phosphatase
MDLMLWRHADAEDGSPDSARKLTRRGHAQAASVAAWLKAHLPEGCEILVSPALRTQQTAAALGMPYATTANVGTAVAARELLAAAGWPERSGAILIVGHQPTLGRVAALLLSGKEADWEISKGALWWFRRTGIRASLRAVVDPEMLHHRGAPGQNP